eukprot:CAMPEP_0181494874 /NCGR_PEP_ID=MMETSP1110-20121109/52054_1 /TAXON_ID=174948 /ORGANISM="Symbiodinium sp., Strain CCMP421" /LENGTH=222 /DNA_ID=CAMNT_0023622415 /DNA_START=30 /DNA_END=695 /DNA_ORIENTATION=-
MSFINTIDQTPFTVDDIPFDYSPLWSMDELTQRQELEKATNGYQELLTFSLYEPGFFEYLDKSVLTETTDLFSETDKTTKMVSSLSQPITPLKHISAAHLEATTFASVKPETTSSKMVKNDGYVQRIPQSRPSPLVGRKRKRSKNDEVAMLAANTGAKQSPKKRKKVQSDGQEHCCIKGCDMGVTNRLRFSLRCTTEFKGEFLERGWNKICHRHYFADLYRF